MIFSKKQIILHVLILVSIILLMFGFLYLKTRQNPYSINKMEQVFNDNKDDFYNTSSVLRSLVMVEATTGDRRSISLTNAKYTSQESVPKTNSHNIEITSIDVLISEEIRHKIVQVASPLFEQTAIVAVDAHSDQIGFWFSTDMGVEHLLVYREDGKTPHGVFFNLKEIKQVDSCWYAIIVSD